MEQAEVEIARANPFIKHVHAVNKDMAETMNDLKPIFDRFNTEGSWLDANRTGSGHIHITWLIRTSEEDKPDYILQKINHLVFPAVAEMMENIRKVTCHIRQQYGPDCHGATLEIIKTMEGKSFLTDPEGNHWRIYRRIEPGISYDVLPGSRVAYEAGKAFGQFLYDLRDMPVDAIYPVIPHFHDIDKRYNRFCELVTADIHGRAAEVNREAAFAKQAYEKLKVISIMQKEGKLPLRIVHNDTKLNNVLFDEHDRAVCVIDLDTVMPGLSLFDFGDAIRTVANTAGEDEPDPGAIDFSMSAFTSFSKGYLEKTRSMLTPAEITLLPLSAQYITFVMGLRFLNDYLDGDVYYPVEYKLHNLVRCRAQFRLLQCMEGKYQACMEAIRQYGMPSL